jgi:hypothetical protein
MKQKLLHRILGWLDRTKAWELFFKKLSIYNLRFKGYPDFVMSDYFRIIDKSCPGDHYVFLSTDSKSISSLLIRKVIRSKEFPVHFSHAGVVLFDGDRNTSIMHVTAAGLIEQALLDFLKQVDYFCAIKLPVDKEDDIVIDNRMKRIRNRASSIKYDWEEQLDNGENLLYCSELVYEVFRDLVNCPIFKPRMVLGRYVFDPNMLLSCGEIVYCNHPDLIRKSLDVNLSAKQTDLIPYLN